MEFATIKEYFYKLQTALFLTLLVPLVIFLVLYSTTDTGLVEKEQSISVISFLLFLMAFDALIGLILFRIKLKRIRELSTLRGRLQHYYSLTIVRSYINIITCIMPALAFFLTAEPLLVFVFGGVLILFSLQWPRPGKVCRDLQLKGDEREMVLYKKDDMGFNTGAK